MENLKNKYFLELYQMEALHSAIYDALSKRENDLKLKNYLLILSKEEEKHKIFWREILKINKIKVPKLKIKITEWFVLLIRKIFGISLTINLLEYFEKTIEEKLDEIVKIEGLSEKELKIINKISSDEKKNERIIEDKITNMNSIIANIRDIIFGLNDGLVEILAVIVGLAMAVSTPILVVLSGFIVSISGTLSMGGGAYISTKYEGYVRKEKRNANKSAFNVGIMYFLGSMFPLAPFILGFSGIEGIILAIIVTTLIISITSTLIAIIGYNKITNVVSKTLIISLGIDVITISIGYFARILLHLPPNI
ncbi:MAG: VIT1/CCC1 transporter family protein [Candidatus Micrarchaeia archaeon]